MKTEIEITAEDFKLIKKFYPEFQRAKGVKSNKYIIDWNGLMPVVDKISDKASVVIRPRPLKERSICTIEMYFIEKRKLAKETNISYEDIPPLAECNSERTTFENTYKAVVEFIKWYNGQNLKTNKINEKS